MNNTVEITIEAPIVRLGLKLKMIVNERQAEKGVRQMLDIATAINALSNHRIVE